MILIKFMQGRVQQRQRQGHIEAWAPPGGARLRLGCSFCHPSYLTMLHSLLSDWLLYHALCFCLVESIVLFLSYMCGQLSVQCKGGVVWATFVERHFSECVCSNLYGIWHRKMLLY
jgi:hypothetical protein